MSEARAALKLKLCKNGPRNMVQQKRYNMHLVRDDEIRRKYSAVKIRNRIKFLRINKTLTLNQPLEDKWF